MNEKDIRISIVVGASAPSKQATRASLPPLSERIDYAIDCIACGVNKQAAIDFLRACKAKMDGVTKQDREFQDLLNKVDVALSDYGHYHMERKR